MRLAAVSLLIFLVLAGTAYSIDLGAYPYFKEINPKVSSNTPIMANLDSQVLNSMKSDGSDLRVLLEDSEVPYKIMIVPAEEIAHKGRIIDSSSTRNNFRGISFEAENIIDGDYSNSDNAYFQIDSVKDPNYAWFTIDLNQPTLTDKISVWSLNNDYSWKSLQIEGSNDNSKWDMIKSKSDYLQESQRTIVYPPVEYRFLKFSFWHTQSLVINEIEIYGAYTGKIIFKAENGKTYKVYYGNNLASQVKYDTSSLFTSKSTSIVPLGSQKFNTKYSYDSDNDGVSNDKCPSISSSNNADSDNDGVGDACDNCQGAANSGQEDNDNDGIGNACDNCQNYPNTDQFDDNFNSIGYSCDDNDNDRVINSKDNCPLTANSNQKDLDRNGIGDSCEDIDKDGVSFSKDNCISKYNPDQKDSDLDRIGDSCDNCLLGSNSDQFDKNANGIGDACEDLDSDSIPNYADNCILASNKEQEDSDNDGLGDKCDNCQKISNNEQTDSNGNGIGDICDDADQDGIINPKDNCPNVLNPDQKDQNNNGIGDSCEDFDNDGVQNHEDNCEYDYNPKESLGSSYIQKDADSDGVGDACDKKDDRITENKSLVWIVLVAAVLIVGFLAISLFRKSANK